MNRRNRGKTGSVMVEFTLSLIFLIPLFLGLWSFGYTFYVYAGLESAVRSGARYASVMTYDSATATPTSSFLTSVQNMTVYGTPTPGKSTQPVVAGLKPANVQLGVTFTSGAPSAVSVSITGFKVPTYPSGYATLSGKPYAWFPYVGTWGPP